MVHLAKAQFIALPFDSFHAHRNIRHHSVIFEGIDEGEYNDEKRKKKKARR